MGRPLKDRFVAAGGGQLRMQPDSRLVNVPQTQRRHTRSSPTNVALISAEVRLLAHTENPSLERNPLSRQRCQNEP